MSEIACRGADSNIFVAVDDFKKRKDPLILGVFDKNNLRTACKLCAFCLRQVNCLDSSISSGYVDIEYPSIWSGLDTGFRQELVRRNDISSVTERLGSAIELAVNFLVEGKMPALQEIC